MSAPASAPTDAPAPAAAPAVADPVAQPADPPAVSAPSKPVVAAPASVAAPAVPQVATAPPVAVAQPPASVASPVGPPPSQVASSSSSVAPSRASSSGKSKKKKAPPSAALAASAAAAAAAANEPPGSIGAQGENTGRWTAEEHRLFLQGLELHGKGWKKIASLIKSRTVVQIRTHAQKYFQKLAKARQNGEEGEIAMEGRGGAASVTAVSPTALAANSKRRRLSTGTKRKVIQSVVASAQRQGKRFGAVGPDGSPLPTAAPALATFVLPVAPSHGGTNSCVPSITTAQGTISGPALEDSLFRFLTPVPVATEPQVNDVARSAGANPITLPSGDPSAAASGGGEGSPTGVTELSAYPSWTDAKDTPSWYSKGADVDALLDVGDTLDWLADTGDLHESYQPAAVESGPCVPDMEMKNHEKTEGASSLETANPSITDMSVSALPTVDTNNVDSVIPPLPSLFDGSTDDIAESMKKVQPGSESATGLEKTVSSSSIDQHLQVFDTPMEEHDFVSTILENATGSTGDLPALS